MKPRAKGIWKIGAVAFLALILSACGSSGSVSSELSESGGGNGGTGISNTFSSPAEMGIGDIMPIEFGNSTSVSVDFSAVSSSARFILTLGSYNSSGAGTSMQLSTNIALSNDDLSKAISPEFSAEELENDGFGPQEIFHAWLRASESTLQFDEGAPFSVNTSMAKAIGVKAAGIGDTQTFRVLSSLSSSTSYVEVTGEAQCVSSNVIFYVDTSVSESVLSASDVDTLCAEFNTVAANEQALLGVTSDINNDGKFTILMTKQINRLGALGGGIITGYFYAGDLYARSSSNPVSNEREIIYTMVPDPQGQYGTAISNEFAMSNLLPAVLPHELQHAISYNQHVFVNEGSAEENWLNEGMSHLIEDIMGYGNENPSRYAMFLASPSTYGVVTQGSPNLMERGASYLFMRFLYEQASNGSAFLGALENTPKRGVENLETAFAGPSDFNGFSEFMARWVTALMMTDRGISQDARYVYRTRVRNSSTGNWEGVCLECEADDNRGTTLDGVYLNQYYGTHNPSIDSSAATFYNVSTIPDRMNFAGTQGGGNFGVLVRTE